MFKNKFWTKTIANMSELGAGTRGASLGLQALQLIDKENRFFSQVEHIPNSNEKILNSSYKMSEVISSIAEINKTACDRISKSLENHARILYMTGDHSNAIGGICGLKKYAGQQPIGVVWIDAHGDLHTPQTTPSGNLHGMPLGACLDLNKISNPHAWGKLTSISGHSPALSPKDIRFIGIRDLEKIEWDEIEKNSMHFRSVSEVRKMGAYQMAKKCLQSFSNVEYIYVSFDVDALDPNISKGTGTPVKNGFQPNEILEMLSVFLQEDKVKVLEITEINPLLDNENKMAQTILEMLDNLSQE